LSKSEDLVRCPLASATSTARENAATCSVVEEAHERGESLQESLLDGGVARLRPVLITVGATVLGLVPLALHGGPLWEALCYAQIGGLMLATAITLLLVPVLYAAFVMDLRWITWREAPRPVPDPSEAVGGHG